LQSAAHPLLILCARKKIPCAEKNIFTAGNLLFLRTKNILLRTKFYRNTQPLVNRSAWLKNPGANEPVLSLTALFVRNVSLVQACTPRGC
jgi:hypothetical protein